MTLVFCFWGEYPGFVDALACAKARAGVPIWVISDGPAPAGVNHLPISSFPKAVAMREALEKHCGRWASFSLARWFVLRDFLLAHPEITLPVFCADWDVILLRNLATAYRPFETFDYTVSRLPEGMESAAYGINCMEPLQVFCGNVEHLNKQYDSISKNLNDMEAWSLTTRTGLWKVGNLYEIQNSSVFDHSMHVGRERFEFKGESLDVVFVEGYPFFRELETGRLIGAVTLHCWGTAKTRTAEFRTLAGIKL